jgi:hypothetical protein
MATAEQRRQEILNFAESLAKGGAHYLWGAEGDKPTHAGGGFAPVALDQPANATFCAATKTVDGKVFVCAGRCSRRAGGGLIPSPDSDPRLKAFIAQWAGKPQIQYAWGDQLTPRLVKGEDVRDYATGGDLTNKVVWGEGCDDTLHFDCGGFVRWVVLQVCGVVIKGISWLPNPATMLTPKHAPMARLVKAGETLLPADIVVYDGGKHIAFAIADDKPAYVLGSTSSYKVAQAECATDGVTYGEKHSATSTKCIRLSDDALTFKN